CSPSASARQICTVTAARRTTPAGTASTPPACAARSPRFCTDADRHVVVAHVDVRVVTVHPDTGQVVHVEADLTGRWTRRHQVHAHRALGSLGDDAEVAHREGAVVGTPGRAGTRVGH